MNSTTNTPTLPIPIPSSSNSTRQNYLTSSSPPANITHRTVSRNGIQYSVSPEYYHTPSSHIPQSALVHLLPHVPHASSSLPDRLPSIVPSSLTSPPTLVHAVTEPQVSSTAMGGRPLSSLLPDRLPSIVPSSLTLPTALVHAATDTPVSSPARERPLLSRRLNSGLVNFDFAKIISLYNLGEIQNILSAYRKNESCSNFIKVITSIIEHNISIQLDECKKINSLIRRLGRKNNQILRNLSFDIKLKPYQNSLPIKEQALLYTQKLLAIYDANQWINPLIKYQNEEGYESFFIMLAKIKEDNKTKRETGFDNKISELILKISKQEHKELRERFFVLAVEATSSCEDRINLFVIQLFKEGAYYDLINNNYPITEIINRLRKLFRLTEIEEQLCKYINDIKDKIENDTSINEEQRHNRIDSLEEIQIFLKVCTEARKRLDIADLIPNQNMVYEGEWGISPEQLTKIIHNVKRKENKEFLAFFLDSDICTKVLQDLSGDDYEKMQEDYIEWVGEIDKHIKASTYPLEKETDRLNKLKEEDASLQSLITQAQATLQNSKKISDLPFILSPLRNTILSPPPKEIFNFITQTTALFNEVGNIQTKDKLNEITIELYTSIILSCFYSNIEEQANKYSSLILMGASSMVKKESKDMFKDIVFKTQKEMQTLINNLENNTTKEILTNKLEVISNHADNLINKQALKDIPLLAHNIKYQTDEGMDKLKIDIKSALSNINNSPNTNLLKKLYEDLYNYAKKELQFNTIAYNNNKYIHQVFSKKPFQRLTFLAVNQPSRKIRLIKVDSSVDKEKVKNALQDIAQRKIKIIQTLDKDHLREAKQNLLLTSLNEKNIPSDTLMGEYWQ